ncbi:MAG: hypothetical protein JWP87_3120 [Labilithrix sp.]|nr:hypothetical protein [Labilithrix sp.]
MSKKVATIIAAGALALVVGSACGSTPESGFDDGTSGGTSGTSGTSGDGTSGSNGTIGSSGATSGGTSGELGACGATTESAKQLPVDLLVMLDASGSMMEQTGASGTGPTKWAAVKNALNGFIGDPKSAGLGVGLQIFPIEHPGSPASCTSNAQCTVGGTSLGRCFLKACHPANANDPITSCDAATDCPGNAACYPLGVCSQGPFTFGNCLVGDPTYGACQIGTCKALATSTCEGTECVLADYSPAKVPIAPLPGNATLLTSTINGTPDPKPEALTPTSVAVQSGIAIAKAHAAANPGHGVVLVLATDGFPTRCAPLDIPGIANLAKTGVGGTPSIKTFVIGVFKDADKATATSNLDAIAAGGGTNKAFIVTTGGNVAADFQKALDTIRGSALPCEYAIPKSEGGLQDLDKVNVQHTDGAGKKEVLAYKKDAAGCGTSAGWYYDVDPATGGTPTKIILCASTCNTVKSESGSAKIDILLGCKTVVK